MFTLYSDKSDTFECTINLEGASIDKSFARLVIESEDYNLMFKGTISKEGICKVPIKKLKNLLAENKQGKIRLEVIAEDTFFTPWTSDFILKASKTVQVEGIKKSSESKDSRIQITEIKSTNNKNVTKNNSTEKSLSHELSEILTKSGINKSNFRKQALPVVKNFIEEMRVKDKRTFIVEVLGYLK